MMWFLQGWKREGSFMQKGAGIDTTHQIWKEPICREKETEAQRADTVHTILVSVLDM